MKQNDREDTTICLIEVRASPSQRYVSVVEAMSDPTKINFSWVQIDLFPLSTKMTFSYFRGKIKPAQTFGHAPHLGYSPTTAKPSRSKTPRVTNVSPNDEQAPRVLKGGIALFCSQTPNSLDLTRIN